MQHKLILFTLLLLAAFAAPAQTTRVDAARLVKPSGTASRILATNSSSATEWVTAAQVLTAGSGISITGNTIATTGLVAGAGVAGQISYFSGATTVTGDNNLFWDASNVRFGVGTNVPDARLHVIVPGSTRGVRISYTGVVGSSASPFFIQSETGVTTMEIGSNRTQSEGILTLRGPAGQGNGTGVNFFSNVGATTRSGLFQLDESGNMVFRNNNTNGGTYFDYTNGCYFRDGSYNLTAIFNSNGLVGIATFGPTERLDVNGGVRFRAALKDGLNAAGTSGQVLKSTGTATQWAADDNIGNTNLTLTSNRTLTFGGFNLTYATAANSFIIDASAATGTLVSPLVIRGKEATPATNALEAQDDAGTWRLRLRTTATEARWLTNSRSTYIEGLNYVALNTAAAGENYWYWNANGTAQWSPKTSDPTANDYTIWANSTTARFKYQGDDTPKTFANLEDDVVGLYDLATTNITLGANLKQEVDANGGAITVTVGSAMREGIVYKFRCRRNGTNTVTLSAESGFNIAVDGVNAIPGQATIILGGAGATGIQAPFKIYNLTRMGSLIFLQ
jgi:hypothetical protein